MGPLPTLVLGLALSIPAVAAGGATGPGEPVDRFPPPLVAPQAEILAGAAPQAPSGTLAPESAPTPSFEAQVVDLVNQERLAAGGLPPLKDVSTLDAASETHSSNMAGRDFFSHCDLDTKTQPWNRMTAAGYTGFVTAAENIAAGYGTPESVVAGWVASPGHYANMISTANYETGVGYVYQSTDQADIRLNPDSNDCTANFFNQGPYYAYWTEDFGRRSGVYPVVIDREAPSTTSTTVDLYVYGQGWAQEMRFSNDGATWSAWEPYQPDAVWTLSGGAGTQTVYAQIRNGATVRQASDTIYLDVACTAAASQTLSGQTVTSTTTYEACDTITAGSGFEVATTAPDTVTFRAPHIVLGNGFSVASGASFTADAHSPP